jgi:hypothetical protein
VPVLVLGYACKFSLQQLGFSQLKAELIMHEILVLSLNFLSEHKDICHLRNLNYNT